MYVLYTAVCQPTHCVGRRQERGLQGNAANVMDTVAGRNGTIGAISTKVEIHKHELA